MITTTFKKQNTINFGTYRVCTHACRPRFDIPVSELFYCIFNKKNISVIAKKLSFEFQKASLNGTATSPATTSTDLNDHTYQNTK